MASSWLGEALGLGRESTSRKGTSGKGGTGRGDESRQVRHRELLLDGDIRNPVLRICWLQPSLVPVQSLRLHPTTCPNKNNPVETL